MTTTDPAPLFEVDPAWVREGCTPGEPVSTGRRLAWRQLDMLRRGDHPMTYAPLHAGAAPADDREAEGARCGGCRFRALVGKPNGRQYPRCQHGATSADGAPHTEIRAWWPACHHFEPKPEPAEVLPAEDAAGHVSTSPAT